MWTPIDIELHEILVERKTIAVDVRKRKILERDMTLINLSDLYDF